MKQIADTESGPPPGAPTRAVPDIAMDADPNTGFLVGETQVFLDGTDYVNLVDNSQGKFYRLQTVDVQSSTLHDTPGYDDETGVGTPRGPVFFLSALLR